MVCTGIPSYLMVGELCAWPEAIGCDCGLSLDSKTPNEEDRWENKKCVTWCRFIVNEQLDRVGLVCEIEWRTVCVLGSKWSGAEDGTESHVDYKLPQNRDDVTWLNSDLARVCELGRSEVCHNHRSQWNVVDQVRDPEWCDRLMVFTIIDRDLNDPGSIRDEIIGTFHVFEKCSRYVNPIKGNWIVSWESDSQLNFKLKKSYLKFAYHPFILTFMSVHFQFLRRWLAWWCQIDWRVRVCGCLWAEPVWVRDLLSFSARLWCEAANLERI